MKRFDMKVVLTNLSNNLFNESRQVLNRSAINAGIKIINSYAFEDIISTPFYSINSAILTQPKGIGYWLWKPHIILETFKNIDDGDIVIYSDCGIEIMDSLKPLIDLCENETDILLFANSNYTNSIWTKRDCFVLMDCDEEKYWNGKHSDAAFCLFKKSTNSKLFLEEWLLYGSNANIITDLSNTCGKHDFPEFVEHRWDQSILSLLAIKYNISFYRMPTQFGNHYKLPEYRVAGEFNCINQGNQAQVDYYSSLPFENSFYYQLLNHHRRRTNSNNITGRTMMQNTNTKNIMNFKTYLKKAIKKILGENGKELSDKKSVYKKYSYSQCGEDLIVQYIFSLRGITKPSYLDIGANHPFFISNTALLYEQGCRGINIEANPQLIESFTVYRPDDINLNIGISNKDEELDFYIMADNTLSTFSKNECDTMVSNGKTLAEIKKIKLTNLESILENHFNNKFPDFMSIDAEGMDLQILQSINFEKSSPKIICVEAAEYSAVGAGTRRSELINFLIGKGYYEYANTNLNAIMVKREFWFI